MEGLAEFMPLFNAIIAFVALIGGFSFAVDLIVKPIKKDMARLEEDVKGLKAGQEELKASFAELKASQDDLKASFAELKVSQAEILAKLSEMSNKSSPL